MAFARTALADGQAFDVAAQFHDFPGEFVAGHKRDGDGLLRPVVPVPDVDVGAADAGLVDADQHVIGADLGHGPGFHPEAGLGFGLGQDLHFVGHSRALRWLCRPW